MAAENPSVIVFETRKGDDDGASAEAFKDFLDNNINDDTNKDNTMLVITLPERKLSEYPRYLDVRECVPIITVLDFGTNMLEILPECVMQLPRLQHLDLRNNLLKELPVEWGNLKLLRYLNLRNNKLAKLPKLPISLLYLQAGQNMLTSAQDVTHLKNLTSLNLSGNQLKRVPKGLNNLVNLEELDLQQNQITHMETGLPRLKKLLELKLRDNRLKTIPCSLSGLESLNFLDVSRNSREIDGSAVYLELMIEGTQACLRYLHRFMRWSPHTHQVHSEEIQKHVFTVFLCANRKSSVASWLPSEVWILILEIERSLGHTFLHALTHGRDMGTNRVIDTST
eukprot:m.105593 g.105593  ORF g.105593 m.105593 type:complete len:339 (-) comp13883_c0_seq5:130-1146(-)